MTCNGEIVVVWRTSDEGGDIRSATSLGGQYVDWFNTDPQTIAYGQTWIPLSDVPIGGSHGYDPTTKPFFVTVPPTPEGRVFGWMEDPNAGLPYSAVRNGEFIWAKFAIYASGQSQNNQIPKMRLRISSRLAIHSIPKGNCYDKNDAGGSPSVDQMAQDLRPSSNPARPSTYRVDMAPPALPHFTENQMTERFQRWFEAYSLSTNPEESQVLALAESSIGVYPALPDSNDPSVLVKTYEGSDFNTTGGGARQYYYQGFRHERGDQNYDNVRLDVEALTVNGGTFESYPLLPTSQVSVIGSGGVLTIDTTGMPDNKLGIVAIDWLSGYLEDGVLSNRVRVEENKIYKIRFHATSTVPSSQNALIRFRARTLTFNWIARLEVGGAILGSAANQIIARQYLPGVGTAHTSGNYDLIFVSPLHKDIRADSTGATIEDLMPHFATQPGPGDSSPSRRDLMVGVDLLDSLPGPCWADSYDPGETGHVQIDRIEIRKYDFVGD